MHQCAGVCRMNFSKCTKRPEYTGESQSCLCMLSGIGCENSRFTSGGLNPPDVKRLFLAISTEKLKLDVSQITPARPFQLDMIVSPVYPLLRFSFPLFCFSSSVILSANCCWTRISMKESPVWRGNLTGLSLSWPCWCSWSFLCCCRYPRHFMCSAHKTKSRGWCLVLW